MAYESRNSQGFKLPRECESLISRRSKLPRERESRIVQSFKQVSSFQENANRVFYEVTSFPGQANHALHEASSCPGKAISICEPQKKALVAQSPQTILHCCESPLMLDCATAGVSRRHKKHIRRGHQICMPLCKLSIRITEN